MTRRNKEAAAKGENASGKGKGTGKARRIVLRVLLVLAIVLLVIVVAGFVSCRTSFTHEGISSAEIEIPSSGEDGAEIEALTVLDAPDGSIYQSQHGFSWEQTEETFDESTEEDGAYAGTDVDEIEAAYCTLACHSESELDAYSADAAEVEATIASMVDDYGCALSDEQVQALVEAYSE